MEKGLKVLMLGSDRQALSPGSAVSERLKEYAGLVAELHVVLLSDAGHGLKDAQLAPNLWVYPTNSYFKYLRPLDAARLGKRLVLEKKFVRGQSVITAQDPFECGWAGLKVKRKWRLPLEVQVHTDPFSPYFHGFQNKVRKLLAGKILRNADSIRVVSESLRQNISERLKIENSKLKILPIYVDRGRVEDAPISFDLHTRYPWHLILLAVARLEPEKNLGLAIQALALVRQRFPDTGLIIAGFGSQESALKAEAQKLGLEAGVVFAGWQENLASFYKTANAFIQTSSFEGYGLALVEAGLSGLPIVSTPVGIANEFKDGEELSLCGQGDRECFAEKIISLIENNDKRENLRINMKKALGSKLLSKENYLEQLADNWQKCASRIG